MSKMVERIAASILAKVPYDYGMTPAEAKEYARTAIETMREPQVEMIAAFYRQKNCGTQEIGERGDATSDYDAWRAAIDAALQEKEAGE